MKKAACFMLVTALLLGCAGCGVSEDAQPGSPDGSDDMPEHELTSLTICVDSTDLIFGFRAFLAQFEIKHPWIDVKYEAIPSGPARENALERLRIKLMAGRGPDVYLSVAYPHKSLHEEQELVADVRIAMESGVFCDMTPYLEDAGLNLDELNATVLKAGQYEGNQVIVPLYYSTGYIVTNDVSRAAIGGDEAFKDPVKLIGGLAELSQVPGALGKSFIGYSSFVNNSYDILFDPFYLSSPYIIDYDNHTVNLDSEFSRSLFEKCTAANNAIRSQYDFNDMMQQYSYTMRDGSSEEVWDEYNEYIRSEKCVIISQELGTAIQDAGYMESVGVTPHIDAIPSQDGGVQAVISAYAAVRSNSEHKAEAAELIKWFLDKDVQRTASYYIGYPAPASSGFWPVRKGIMPDVLEKYVYPMLHGQSAYSTTGVYYFPDSLSEETTAQFINIENSITNACFPVPSEVRALYYQYFNSAIDLDTAMAEMQEYLERSLWSAS